LNKRGFTLLELLISITMLAFIIGIISGALSLASQSLNRGAGKINSLERVKTSFSLVESQIQSLFVSQYVDQGEKKVLFSGQKDRLLFATNYSIWGGIKGNTLVEYAVEGDDKGKQNLKVTENTIGLDTKRETVLFTGYDKIFFEYFSKNIFEEGKWVDEWSKEEKGIPEKININLISGAKNMSLVVHIYVKAPPASSSGGGAQPTSIF
jgi:prepilin-type N-terminal cleavage/methylation domain-containing protein